MPNQPEFHLPPHGPVCFAAEIPADVAVEFCDEHVQPLYWDDQPDLVAMSVMLTCQMPRAWEIADHYRARKIPVIFGGIATATEVSRNRKLGVYRIDVTAAERGLIASFTGTVFVTDRPNDEAGASGAEQSS